MMNRKRFEHTLPTALAVFLVLATWLPTFAADRDKTVWVVFFGSSECSKCESVERILEALKRHYPVKIRKFDISRDSSLRLFEKMEAIHSDGGFAIPLVMLGNTVLIGEDRIVKGIEATVRDLYFKGGSAQPYLGPQWSSAAKASSESSVKRQCDSCGGRPPTIQEEWAKVRKFIDGLFLE